MDITPTLKSHLSYSMELSKVANRESGHLFFKRFYFESINMISALESLKRSSNLRDSFASYMLERSKVKDEDGEAFVIGAGLSKTG